MKTIVIYMSKTGYTKQYAEMLSEALGCEAISKQSLSNINLNEYDRIIYGGGIRANKISGFKSMLKRFDKLTGKQIIVFAVGATGISDENSATLYEKNIKENEQSYPFFYLHGGFDPDKLTSAMRFMLKRVEVSIKKKQAKDPDSLDAGDKDFLDFFQTPHTNVNMNNLEEILKFIHD